MIEARRLVAAFGLAFVIPIVLNFIQVYLKLSSYTPAGNPVALANKNALYGFFANAFAKRSERGFFAYIGAAFLLASSAMAIAGAMTVFERGVAVGREDMFAFLLGHAFLSLALVVWKKISSSDKLDFAETLERLAHAIVFLLIFCAALRTPMTGAGAALLDGILLLLYQPYLLMNYNAEEDGSALPFERMTLSSARFAHNFILGAFLASSLGFSDMRQIGLAVGAAAAFLELLAGVYRFESMNPDTEIRRKARKWMLNILLAAAAAKALL